MNLRDNLPKYLVLGFFVIGGGLWLWKTFGSEKGTSAVSVAVAVPQLSEIALKGKQAFDSVCADCHGANAAGTDKGPPLVHDIYNPGHHPDEAFLVAARFGVRQHHWPYGNMPAQPQMSQDEVVTIIKYVRELQAANGITYRPHTM